MFKPDKETLKTITAILFLLSGATGLVYQIVWFKYLHLFLGNTTYAQTTVLATFLGGLAIGNHLFGKHSGSIKHPLFIYGILETIIGVYCFAYPMLVNISGNLFLSTSSSLDLEPTSFAFSSFRFFTSIIILILPTILMGGTLPVLTKYFVTNLSTTRENVGSLYFLNSFGAVVGIFFAGFFLIREFGIAATIYTAAIINIVIGLVAMLLGRIKHPENVYETDVTETLSVDQTNNNRKVYRTIIMVAGVSGFAALLYEMVWVKLLVNFFGSSTYAFSIMLMSFICGITIGGFIVAKSFISRYNKITLIVFFQSAIAFTTMIALLLYDRLPYFLWKSSMLFSRNELSFPLFIGYEFFICFILILLPTLFMGMTLPLCVEIISKSNRSASKSVGKIFSFNTAGTVLGVVITGLILIPAFGIKTTFEIGIAINISCAIAVLLILSDKQTKTKHTFTITAAALSVVYIFLFPTWNKASMLSGVFRNLKHAAPATFENFTKLFSDNNILYYKEGISSTVAVTQSQKDDQRVLLINGKPDASSAGDMPTQILLGQIPTMLHPNPQNVFVIGFGSGTTIGSVLKHPVKKVTCAEISNEVIEAAIHFKKENNNCLTDTRLKVINEDAITLLKLSKEKYDVIISEPSNPWIAGIGNLFTTEYFSKCFEKLSDDGIMVQWFHLYEMDDEIIKIVLNTFNSVFKNAQVWNSVSNDIILIGTKKPYTVDPVNLKAKFLNPALLSDMKKIGIDNPLTFLSCQVMSSNGLFLMGMKNQFNSEINPKLEFLAPKAFYIGQTSRLIDKYDERYDSLTSNLLVNQFLKSYTPTKQDLLNGSKYHLDISLNNHLAYSFAKRAMELFPNDYQTQIQYQQTYNQYGFKVGDMLALEKSLKTFPDSSKVRTAYYNNLIVQKLSASSFIGFYNIDEEVNQYIEASKKDSLEYTKALILAANNYMFNSEYVKANKFISMAETIMVNNKEYSNSIPMDDFYYISAISALYSNRIEKVLSYYLGLLNNFPDYHLISKLRQSVQLKLSIKF